MGMECVGKYKLEEVAGRGGFAVVYKAWDPSLKRHVAIKVLHVNRSDDPRMVERFHREAQGMAILRHPHIVHVYEIDEFGEAYRRPYIAMEYLPGRSLYTMLEEEGALSLQQILTILEQVGSALDCAHSQGIIHRDVNPKNIMVEEREDGSLNSVLTDFGLVKMLESSEVLTTSEIIGTPAYMAPEQVAGDSDDIGPATDIYALGVTAYRMLTGRVPFEGNSKRVMFAHVQEAPPDPSGLGASVSEGVAAVLLRCLEKAPGDRYDSAGQMVAALREAIGFTDTFLELPEMVRVPAGVFLMGSPDDDPEAQSNEKPRHEMSTWAYEIGKYPVTNAQYAMFVQATGYSSPLHWTDGKPPCGKESHPVVNVSLYDAQAYCRWLGRVAKRTYRLPTEEEWEKAAGGADSGARPYPWGETYTEGMCNTVESGIGDTTPVDAYECTNVSPYGAVDMAGNVWEWTESLYRRYDQDPVGPGMFVERRHVVRGGAWSIPAVNARVSCRGRYQPEKTAGYLGFRVVLEVD